MVSLPVVMLVDKNLYPLDRQVRVWVDTAYTRIPIDKIYTHHTIIINNKSYLN
jgi:diphthamide synthase subunit DPH2